MKYEIRSEVAWKEENEQAKLLSTSADDGGWNLTKIDTVVEYV